MKRQFSVRAVALGNRAEQRMDSYARSWAHFCSRPGPGGGGERDLDGLQADTGAGPLP